MAQQGVLTNLDGLVWNKGYCYGTRSGGVADAIGFGALQSISCSHTFNKVELSGPEALSPLGAGIGSEQLTVSFESGVVTPEQFLMALGGAQAYDAGTGLTTYSKLVNDEPRPFDLKIQTDTISPEITLTLFNCVADSWNILNSQNRNWVLGGGSARVYGQSVTTYGSAAKLFTWAKPGNLTNAS